MLYQPCVLRSALNVLRNVLHEGHFFQELSIVNTRWPCTANKMLTDSLYSGALISDKRMALIIYF